MEIYRGRIDVLDYVFFATVERGKVYQTGAFIHNYALAYALQLATSPYTHMIQKPEYERELAPLNEAGIYLTPARPLKLSYRITQWNTVQEGYGFGKKRRDIGYPDWGFALVLRPESSLEFYLLVNDFVSIPELSPFRNVLAGKASYIRLGKFMGKARVGLVKAHQVLEKEGAFTAGHTASKSGRLSLLLNWRDIPADPISCEVYPETLPTRLIQNPRFSEGKHYLAKFGDKDEVLLPAEMRFIARPI